MEKSSTRKSSDSRNNGEQNVLGKRKAAAVEESALLRTSEELPKKVSCRWQLQPSTTLRLDLNRKQPSYSFEANSAPDHQKQLRPKSKSHLSLLNEYDEDDDQSSLPLPLCIRERIDIIDQLIKQQGEHLTIILADQQKNIYKMMGDTMGKKLRETTTKLDKARLKIVELENVVRYLNDQIDNIQSNNEQLKERLQEVREKQLPWDMNLQENNVVASVYSTAHQPKVGESSRVNTIQAKMPQCKVCGKGLPTVILWPCHHLCLCKYCENDIHACPCCGTPKLSSSMVFFP